MKSTIQLFAIAASALLFGCGQGEQKADDKPAYTSHLTVGKHCYKALFEKDSAAITFDVAASGKIKGELAIQFNKNDTLDLSKGEVTGEFKGDTLFGEFSFKNKGTQYVNPVALLHKGDTLLMGQGRVMEYLGRTYFDPQVPIKFEKARFRFVPVECAK
ncbi:hypothetical protein [Mucilaginibacter myungsuensis]|uniref:Lipoprotein n=1 Tax=Mucilaginibacter myungsuensis TaxID=649104 RepID=A0A929PU35_9SPHI|nr:hypothetical protein [Mucilaginibacter myungsuensis]MBE9660333.1 hypothetical protein [Mucilaginibacter myungsuensis]MDN3600375.1 hypothetical protein [Mucilaginibacter myungsuensis]